MFITIIYNNQGMDAGEWIKKKWCVYIYKIEDVSFIYIYIYIYIYI